VERRDRVADILEVGTLAAVGGLAAENSLDVAVDCMEVAASLYWIAGILTVVVAGSFETVDSPAAVDNLGEGADIPAAADSSKAAGNLVAVGNLAVISIPEAVGNSEAADIPEELAGDILAAGILEVAAGTDFGCRGQQSDPAVAHDSQEEVDNEL